jgi:murein peptide amidase A
VGRRFRSFFLIALMGSWSGRAHANLWKWTVISELAPVEFAVQELCKEIHEVYRRLKWPSTQCEKYPFKIFGWSVEKKPLIYYEKGAAKSKLTLIQCAVHGDEMTALPMCMNVIKELEEGTRVVPEEMRIVVQPLLNPDGYLKIKPTRNNANGIDINRNFPSPEWDRLAHTYWMNKDKKDPRKFPGTVSGSEPETQAIQKFIDDFKPQKIISIHTPLGFLELDTKGDKDKERRAKFLAINMLKNTKDLDFKVFGVWPGSLGNYAGRYKQIPVYTMELPPGDSKRRAQRNWDSFSFGLFRAINFDLETGKFNED